MLNYFPFLEITLSDSFVDKISGFFDDITNLGTILKDFVLSLPSFFSWLPVEAISILSLIFGLVILLRILGRH